MDEVLIKASPFRRGGGEAAGEVFILSLLGSHSGRAPTSVGERALPTASGEMDTQTVKNKGLLSRAVLLL